MINKSDGNTEPVSREEILGALIVLTETPNVNSLHRINEGRAQATNAERIAAETILACIEAVHSHGGLDLSSALQRIYAYSRATKPVSEIYEIAETEDPALPTSPTRSEDVYACRAILDALELAGVRL